MRQFGQVFDEVADEYDKWRSGYPEDVLEAAIDIGGLGVGSKVVEVGCGTGKLTELLVANGLCVEAVEPGPSMVALARERVQGSENVRFHLTTFEEVELPEGEFEAVFSASAFHWVDPRVGWRRAASLLRPDGLLGLVTPVSVYDERTAETDDEMMEVLRRHAPEVAARVKPPRRLEEIMAGVAVRSENISDVWSWIGFWDVSVPEAADLFEHVEVRGFRRYREMTADEVWAFFRTTAIHASMEPTVRDALEAADRSVVQRHGGTIGSSELVVLATARRSD